MKVFPFHSTLTGDPVNGDALDPTDAGGDDVLPPGLVPFGPGYPIETHICPVHRVIPCQTVNRLLTRGNGMMNVCPQRKQLMKPHFTAATPHFTKCCVGTIKDDGEKISTALCWHTVPQQEEQVWAKFYRPVYCFMQNMVWVKLLWTLSDFTALLHKHIK